MDVVVGVDIGGTKVAAGRVTAQGTVRGSLRTVPTPTEDADAVVSGVVAVVRDVLADGKAAGESPVAVGIGCAGTIDWARGVVVVSPHVPLTETPLASLVAGQIGLPVILDNDANVAALAEARVGAGRGSRHLVMFTLGTGVGGGLILDGRLYRGSTGAAAELGHTVVAAGGEMCRCGGRGCLEEYASGRALERYYGKGLTGVEVGRLAARGDPGALAAVAQVSGWLGVGLTNAANTFNPEVIVVGGGLSELGELLLAPAREVMATSALCPNRDIARVVGAALGNDAGVLGAALLAWEDAVL